MLNTFGGRVGDAYFSLKFIYFFQFLKKNDKMSKICKICRFTIANTKTVNYMCTVNFNIKMMLMQIRGLSG